MEACERVWSHRLENIGSHWPNPFQAMCAVFVLYFIYQVSLLLNLEITIVLRDRLDFLSDLYFVYKDTWYEVESTERLESVHIE